VWLVWRLLTFSAAAILAVVTLAATSDGQPRLPTAEAAQVDSGPFATNVTDTSFVVSWITSTPSQGYVKYGTESGVYPNRVDDERGASYAGYTHFVRVTGLLGGNTKYFYSIVSGDSTLDSPSTYYVITGPTAAATDEVLVTGMVQKQDGSEAAGALVYVFPQKQSSQNTPSSMVWLAALTETDGFFSIDVGKARVATNTAKTVGGAFGVLAAGDRVRYRAVGGIGVRGELNQTDWQQRELTQATIGAGTIELEPFALPYGEQPTPTPSPSATATVLATATPTRTVSPTPATSPTIAAAPTAPAPPTRAPVVTTPTPPSDEIPSVATSEPALVSALTPTLPPSRTIATPTPRAAPKASPAALGPVRRPPSPTARPQASPTAEASPTPIPTAQPTAAAIPNAVTDLVTLAAVLLGAGLGLAAFGVASTVRRRAA
jgi:hypothetical protein